MRVKHNAAKSVKPTYRVLCLYSSFVHDSIQTMGFGPSVLTMGLGSYVLTLGLGPPFLTMGLVSPVLTNGSTVPCPHQWGKRDSNGFRVSCPSYKF